MVLSMGRLRWYGWQQRRRRRPAALYRCAACMHCCTAGSSTRCCWRACCPRTSLRGCSSRTPSRWGSAWGCWTRVRGAEGRSVCVVVACTCVCACVRMRACVLGRAWVRAVRPQQAGRRRLGVRRWQGVRLCADGPLRSLAHAACRMRIRARACPRPHPRPCPHGACSAPPLPPLPPPWAPCALLLPESPANLILSMMGGLLEGVMPPVHDIVLVSHESIKGQGGGGGRRGEAGGLCHLPVVRVHLRVRGIRGHRVAGSTACSTSARLHGAHLESGRPLRRRRAWLSHQHYPRPGTAPCSIFGAAAPLPAVCCRCALSLRGYCLPAAQYSTASVLPSRRSVPLYGRTTMYTSRWALASRCGTPTWT